jgi:DNA-binding response OmpR family regulator
MPRILVMEDDASMRDVICRVLVDAGYEAVEAADGAVGLHLWHARGADLVLTDIEMPELNGIEVILELLGAVGLLYKPFSIQELLTTVGMAFERA